MLGGFDFDAPYEERLLYSAVNFPEAWEAIILSEDGDVEKAYASVTGNREKIIRAEANEKGYTTSLVTADDVVPIPKDMMVDVHEMGPQERAAALAALDKAIQKTVHAFSPTKPFVPGILLGGTGSRWQKDRKTGDQTYHQFLKDRAGSLAKYLEFFKAAVPVSYDTGSEQGVPMLIPALGGKEGMEQLVAMTNESNSAIAKKFIRDVQEALFGQQGSEKESRFFIQPVTVSRVPSKAKLEEFFKREPKEKRDLTDKGELERYDQLSAERSGQIAFDENGAPVIGAENHWDFTKYFFLNGTFLQVFQDNMENGQLKDVFMRVGNQDEFGTTVGEGRPPEFTLGILRRETQKEEGLYALIEQMEKEKDEMGLDAWQEYILTPEFHQRTRKVRGVVIEGAATVGRNTGGGLAGLKFEDGTVNVGVIERGNFSVENPPEATITNTNTLTYSLMGAALMAGILPSMAQEMVQNLEKNGKISEQQQSIIEKGIQLVEESGLPVRSQVKVGNVSPQMRFERDIHGPWGRLLGADLVTGESYSTYKMKVGDLDRQLLRGGISAEDHHAREREIAMNISFAPGKKFDDLLDRERLVGMLVAEMGLVEKGRAFQLKSPVNVIAEMPDAKRVQDGYLQALVDAGYFLDPELESDVTLIRGFISRNAEAISAAEAEIKTARTDSAMLGGTQAENVYRSRIQNQMGKGFGQISLPKLEFEDSRSRPRESAHNLDFGPLDFEALGDNVLILDAHEGYLKFNIFEEKLKSLLFERTEKMIEMGNRKFALRADTIVFQDGSAILLIKPSYQELIDQGKITNPASDMPPEIEVFIPENGNILQGKYIPSWPVGPGELYEIGYRGGVKSKFDSDNRYYGPDVEKSTGATRWIEIVKGKVIFEDYTPGNNIKNRWKGQGKDLRPEKRGDSAMMGAREDLLPKIVAASDEKGGIDFNPELLDLQIKRDGKGVPLPLPMQDLEQINIEGLYPVIINIAPAGMMDIPFLMGMINLEAEITLSKK